MIVKSILFVLQSAFSFRASLILEFNSLRSSLRGVTINVCLGFHLKVTNGETGTIRDVDEKGNCSLKTDSGKTVDFNIKDYNFIGHACAVTAYKAQDQTAQEVLYHAESGQAKTNYNEF